MDGVIQRYPGGVAPAVHHPVQAQPQAQQQGPMNPAVQTGSQPVSMAQRTAGSSLNSKIKKEENVLDESSRPRSSGYNAMLDQARRIARQRMQQYHLHTQL